MAARKHSKKWAHGPRVTELFTGEGYTPFHKLSEEELIRLAREQIRLNDHVGPQMHRELIDRQIESYNPKTRHFRRTGRPATPVNSLSDAALRMRYYRERKEGGVSDEVNNEMVRRFAGRYNADARRFFVGRQARPADAAQNTRKQKRAKKTPVFTPNEYLAQSMSDPNDKREILVWVAPVDQNGQYSIYANGRELMTHHRDTRVEIFGDGTLLAVHGTVTDNPDLPQTPIWRVYDTNLELSQYEGYDKYHGYNIHIKTVLKHPDGVSMRLSNGVQLLMDLERLKRHALGRTFKIITPPKMK